MTGANSYASDPAARRTIVRWLTVFSLLVLCAPSVYAGIGKALKHERRHEIDQLEQSWREAILHSDATVLNNLLSDDYTGITAKGMLQSKDEAVTNLRSRQIVSLEVSDRKVRFYGVTAVVTSLAQVQGTKGNEDISGSFRYTHVYVQDSSGVWKLVSSEASRIPRTVP